MADDTRETMVERSRREVAETIAKARETAQRALEAKYNLVRHSDRRWRVVRVSSVADITFGIADVITFEYVSAPLPFDQALRVLADKRGVSTTVAP